MQYSQLKALLTHQTELIGKIALETDLGLCLNDIALHAEKIIENSAKASILLVEDNHLVFGAAPSLSTEFSQILDHLLVSLKTAPCAVAAFTGQPVIISNLEETEFCKNFIHISKSNNVKACWSLPIFSSQKIILGIFNIYYPQAISPTKNDLEIVKHFTHLTSLALEKNLLKNQQQKAQKQIEQLAFYDPLTDLPNRRLLMSQTQKIIQKIKSENLYGALIFVDLNGFKRINDSLGHHVGDELLIAVSHRLQSSIRNTDTIARIGGDEFVILVEDLQHSKQDIEYEAKLVANRTLNDLEQHFVLSGGRYKIDASIGISVICQDDSDAIEVLKHADAAMYEAKKSPLSRICFHNDNLQKTLDDRLAIESEINHALEQLAFHAYYQPQVDLEGHLIAAEALIRWQHPDKGVICPGDFISVAERMGVIHKMQDTVLNEICQTLNLLDSKHCLHDKFRISINVCPSQLKSNTLPATLMKTLNQYNLSPKHFMLEITEGMLIEDLPKTVGILENLSDLGFKISIDDFGTGYSSLAYLNTLPINEIKIDKSFMATLSNEPSTHGVIDTVISLSKHFQFDVIAEGVEETEQLDAIRLKDVKGLQGYLFAKPMNQDDFVDWVQAA
mgnify:FL=1